MRPSRACPFVLANNRGMSLLKRPLICAVVLLPFAARADDPVGQSISTAIVRWFPSQNALNTAKPSMVFEVQPQPIGAAPADFPIRPAYGSMDGRTTATLKLAPGDSLYGVGRYPGPLLRNGQNFNNAPVDTAWVLCVHADGTAFGAFADTTHATGLSLEGEIKFRSDDPNLPIVVIRADSPREAVSLLNELSGRMEMPPLWALGYQQLAAYSDVQLKLAMKWLRDSRIPCSTLWLGVENTGTPMTYMPSYVPDPKALLDEAKAQGFKVVGLIGRAIPDREDAPLRDALLKGDFYVRTSEGEPFKIEIGERMMLLPDFGRAETRLWWSGLITQFAEPGLSGIMSQRLNVEGLPAGVIIRADEALGGPGDGQTYQELLDTQFARSVRQALGGERANWRPLVMVDARALGAQRYTGAWVDWPDRTVEWPRQFLRAALNTSMSGQFQVGTIIKPPFQGDGSEVNTRWIGVAATFPMVFGSFFLPTDLSLFPKAAERTMRQAMERRSRLIPYLYTQCFDAFFTCKPILQPLFFADPTDPALRDSEAGFLIGNDLLVVPKLIGGPPPGLPLKGDWKKLDFGDSDNPELPDLYLRPGAVIALGPSELYPDEKPTDPVTIVANPNEQGVAEGFLYEDKGDGYEFYRNQARRIGYRVTREGDAYMARLSLLDFGLPLPDRVLEIQVMTSRGVLTGKGSEKGTVRIPIPNSDKP